MELTFIDEDHIGLTVRGQKVVIHEIYEDNQMWWNIYTLGEHRVIDHAKDSGCWQDCVASFADAVAAVEAVL